MIYDCLVIGGGPAGSAAAITLARQGRRVGLLYQASDSAWQIGESLPAAAKPALRQLGAEALLENGQHAVAYGNAALWAKEEVEVQDFLRYPFGSGWHLDRQRFDTDLRALACTAGVDVQNTLVRKVQRDASVWQLSTQTKTFTSRTLIDATGRRAWLARRMGAKRLRDTALFAVHTWYPKQYDDGMTRIEATPQGWWYAAPLPDGKQVVAFHSAIAPARALLKSPDAWHQALHATQQMHPKIQGNPLTPLRITEACGAQTIPSIGAYWIAVGDAACSFDPIASQGITNALYTGLQGAQGVQLALDGDMQGLEAYAKSLDKVRSSYLVQHTQTYYEVARFSDMSFWKDRRAI